MNDLIKKISKSAKLISLPEIYFQLKALLDDPDYTMAEVALLVGRDPGLAARFLRMVNSPFYRRAAKIDTIGHAVSMMGSRQVHDVVLSVSVSKAFDGMVPGIMDMRQFWQRSAYCAMTARQLAIEHGGTDSERLFVIGLLADIGHLCMYLGIPEEAQEAIRQAKEEDRSLSQVEQELLGFDFSQVAALMMKHWHLPVSLHLPIACQLMPGKADEFALEAALLHLASLLVQADLEAGVFGSGAFSVDPAAETLTGLSEQQCHQAKHAAAELYYEVGASLF